MCLISCESEIVSECVLMERECVFLCFLVRLGVCIGERNNFCDSKSV